MARINRSDIIQKAVNDLGLSAADAKVPNETLDKVQLTYNLNRQFSTFIVASGSSSTGTFNTALPTVSTGSETYLTGVTLSFIKDSTCDIATGAVQVSITPTDSNVASVIINAAVLTLTAQDKDVFLALPYPFKVKNASNISVSGTFTVGAMRRNVSAFGFVTSSN